MRLGVSGKIFLAYVVLLLAFAGNAAFALLTMHRARLRIVANQAYFNLLFPVDDARNVLNDVAPGRNPRPDPNLALSLKNARQRLAGAMSAIDRFLEGEPGSARRPQFESYHREIARLDEQVGLLAEGLGAAQAGSNPDALRHFESRLVTVIHNLSSLRKSMRGESGHIAQQLRLDEENALTVALLLGVLGLVAAVGVGFSMLRTLRPLGVLRARARAVAGGEYGRRTGVRSRDEIGDLAREFDAMAGAIEERERRLIQSERLATVGRMAAQITHEIRNPLASIGLYAELLGDEIDGGKGEARRLVTSITSEVDRLTEITETYLRFARLPQPKLMREDLAAIVSSVMEFARAELSQASISLDVEMDAGLPEVAADENQLRQALLNLVRNAREAMPDGGQLHVRVSAGDQGTVRVSVGDTGPGIAPEHVGKIFDPFFSTKDGGTGLGLALVQQIVAEHGGRIEVQSGEDRAGGSGGTTFVIGLPALARGGSPRILGA